MDERIVKIVSEARKSLDEKPVSNSQNIFGGFRNLRAQTKIRFLPPVIIEPPFWLTVKDLKRNET